MTGTTSSCRCSTPPDSRQHDVRRQRPDLRGQGLELQIGAQALRRPSPCRVGSWNSSEQTNSPCLPVYDRNDRGCRQPDPGGPVHYADQWRRKANSRSRIRSVCWVHRRPSRRDGVQPAGALRLDDRRATRRSPASARTTSARSATNRPVSSDGSAQPVPTTTLCVHDAGIHDLRRALGVAKDSWTALIFGRT